MIIYNVTIKVDNIIAAEWLHWLKEQHIPDMKATGCFTEARIFHLLETDEEDGKTYAVQYSAPDLSSYHKYLDEFSTQMRKKGMDKWSNHFVAFRSVLELVH